MKALGTITIKAASRNDLKQAEEIMGMAIEQARLRINNGSKIKLAWTNGDDPSAMAALTGQLHWWALGKTPLKGRKPEKKKGWGIGDLFREIGKQAKEVYEYDPAKEFEKG